MSYTIKIKNGKKIVSGTYIPKGESCECRECKFTIEVPFKATDVQIGQLVNMIRG